MALIFRALAPTIGNFLNYSSSPNKIPLVQTYSNPCKISSDSNITRRFQSETSSVISLFVNVKKMDRLMLMNLDVLDTPRTLKARG